MTKGVDTEPCSEPESGDSHVCVSASVKSVTEYAIVSRGTHLLQHFAVIHRPRLALSINACLNTHDGDDKLSWQGMKDT
jgi:hypothetical protein